MKNLFSKHKKNKLNYKVKNKKSKLSYKTKHQKKKKVKRKPSTPKYNINTYKENKDIKAEIEKRYNILTVIIILLLLTLVIGLFFVQVVKHEEYQKNLKKLTKKIVYGPSAPRGRIYDRNGKLIVDNIPSKVIYYKKPSKVQTKQEIKLAYKLADMISLETKINEKDLKNFWIKNNKELSKEKITKKEWKKYKERKIDDNDINDLIMERINEEDLNKYDDRDKKAAYIYTLMNTGYSYAEKIIKNEGVTDEEYALVSENINLLDGINTKLDWERTYPYEKTFKSMLGTVSTSKSGIPLELKDYYLKKGYTLDDRVGISYLEYQYEDILKGKKNKYEVLNDGTYKLIKEGSRGTDITISIDIELQKEIEQILSEEVLATKLEANTEYYNRSFVIISDPKTGEILAMAGKQLKEEDGMLKVYDYTPGILTTSVVMGSVVKGASHIVGYNTGALKIGETRYDSCVKIAATPEKCSWKPLGSLNDITAIAQSSNTYQYYTAIKVGKGNYKYNAPLSLDPEAFKIYRDTFAQFGLGVKTEIDLPKETTGYKGTDTAPGHLLDFAIGQYDNYTPIELSQYIGTIATGGKRMKMHLYMHPYNEKDDQNIKELNTVNTKPEYMERVKEGFKAVTQYGTGVGYINPIYRPAGKTGTSQSFVDTNGDGKVDTETISTTFVAYAPFEDPRVSFVVISPDVSHNNGRTPYQSNINKRIADRVSKKYFDFYQ
ncbi:MAG: penicillin-binding protein 2 [Bacilli bacterium]|nr:penicillin-binding protein 2 [Bacilli bacterium]